jgi:DNA-3-methyladenine glycosylase I
MTKYHDEEWGVPVHDDKTLFEFLVLEGAQAGLSWNTILIRREGYRQAFSDYSLEEIVQYDDHKIEELMLNQGIIRNKLKILSVIKNAKACLELEREFGSFGHFIWQFTDYKPIMSDGSGELVTSSLASDKMSKALKKRGFNFVGSTICYAFMQAVGMVNDHTKECFRYKELGKL